MTDAFIFTTALILSYGLLLVNGIMGQLVTFVPFPRLRTALSNILKDDETDLQLWQTKIYRARKRYTVGEDLYWEEEERMEERVVDRLGEDTKDSTSDFGFYITYDTHGNQMNSDLDSDSESDDDDDMY
jgi:hypothetical protein